MGGIASGLFNLFSGDPTKKEEGQLGDLGTYETGVGQKGTDASLGYDLGILSGDPAKIAETLAPEISAQNQQTEQGKLTTAEFGNRSGGNNASGQAMDDRARGNIINLIGGLQQGAAQHAGNLGTYDLSMASPNIEAVAGLKRADQARKAGAIGSIATGVGSVLAGLPMGGGASGAGDVVGTLNPAFKASVPMAGAEPGAFDWSGVDMNHDLADPSIFNFHQ